MDSLILALDQGTTSSRAILFNRQGRAVATAQQEYEQILPGPGEVEHDPEAIWNSQFAVARQAIQKANCPIDAVAAIGIANQRETTILWERKTGRPVHNAIVWQSRVSASICEQLKRQGQEPVFRQKTGLVVDAYFSATKIKHLLDHVDGLKARALRGEILFGTVDTWLMWKLSGGKFHATDVSNASRTMLFNIHTLDWDEELLAILEIPRAMLPEVRDTSGIFGETDPNLFGQAIPIAAAAGDQQAATFGQACFETGSAKNTYGTGCFLLMNTGDTPVASQNNLLTTIGWRMGGRVVYCLEGAVFVAGAAVQWLRDGLKAITQSADVERLADSVPDRGGVYLVPAFVGLGAPYWDPYARGTIVGMERGTNIGHIARAVIEAMAFQSRDLLEAMQKDAGIRLAELRVDGGASANNLLLQFQADILGTKVRRPVVNETTALGAAYLAGLAVGVWENQNDVKESWALDREFEPRLAPADRESAYRDWLRAVERSRSWAVPRD